jgi:hypothetical protein
MIKFLLQRFLGDSVRHAILRGLHKSHVEKLDLKDPLHREQISFNILEQIAIDSEKGIQAGKQIAENLNKVRKKRTARFKP